MATRTLKLDIELTDQEAWDLAQFCKRLSFSDFEGCSVDENEAYRMRDAQDRVFEALRRHGYSPR